MDQFDIYERTFYFAVRVAKLLNCLPNNFAVIEYKRQLVKASGSTGANLEEVNGAVSRKDFLNKLGIARKDARESKYWLKILREVTTLTDSEQKKELSWLIMESSEIILILSSIIKKTANRG